MYDSDIPNDQIVESETGCETGIERAVKQCTLFCRDISTPVWLCTWPPARACTGRAFCGRSVHKQDGAINLTDWVIADFGNDLSPVRRQAITRTNTDSLSIGTPGTNVNEIWIKIQQFSFKKTYLKISSVKWQSCCLGLNVSILSAGATPGTAWMGWLTAL